MFNADAAASEIVAASRRNFVAAPFVAVQLLPGVRANIVSDFFLDNIGYNFVSAIHFKEKCFDIGRFADDFGLNDDGNAVVSSQRLRGQFNGSQNNAVLKHFVHGERCAPMNSRLQHSNPPPQEDNNGLFIGLHDDPYLKQVQKSEEKVNEAIEHPSSLTSTCVVQ